MTDNVNTEVLAVPAGGRENMRQSIHFCLRNGQTHEAIQAARTLLEREPGRRIHRFLRDALAAPDLSLAGLRPLKVALLSSFSIEFIHDSLVALGFVAGLKIDIYQAGFGTFRQELLNPASRLYAQSPDVVILAVEGED